VNVNKFFFLKFGSFFTELSRFQKDATPYTTIHKTVIFFVFKRECRRSWDSESRCRRRRQPTASRDDIRE